MFYEEWIDADRCDRRHVRIGAGTASLLTERGDLARGVLTFERGQIDHRNRGLETPQLRALLDASGVEFGHPLFNSNLIYCPDLVEELAESRAHGGSCGGGHGPSNIASRIPHYNASFPVFPPKSPITTPYRERLLW